MLLVQENSCHFLLIKNLSQIKGRIDAAAGHSNLKYKPETVRGIYSSMEKLPDVQASGDITKLVRKPDGKRIISWEKRPIQQTMGEAGRKPKVGVFEKIRNVLNS